MMSTTRENNVKKPICDVCDSVKDIQCEVFLMGDSIERVFHLCPKCLVDVYRECLEDFLEDNEYKVNTFLRAKIDSRISNVKTMKKLESSTDIDKDFNPDFIRRTKPYSDLEEEVE